MREIDVKEVENKVQEIFSEICFKYEAKTLDKLRKACNTSEGREKEVLNLLIENEEVAKSERIPLCQDTGMAVVYLEVGQEVNFINGDINTAINDGVSKAYKDNFLRYSIVEEPLFERKNTNNNTPAIIHYEIVKGDKVRIYGLAKGQGSENASRVIMLTPASGINGVKEEVLKLIKEKGPNACPPLTVGIGIGGSMDSCAWLAKKALLRNEENNSNPLYAKLEKELLEEINNLNIGPAGLHGKNTAIKVAIEYAPTHIAGLPLAINLNCHALRKGEVIL